MEDLSPDAQLMWKEMRLAGFKEESKDYVKQWFDAYPKNPELCFQEPTVGYAGWLNRVSGLWYVEIPRVIVLPARDTDIEALQGLLDWWRDGCQKTES